jgi:hypothetical protein
MAIHEGVSNMVLVNGLVWVSLLLGATTEKVPPDWKVQVQWYRVLPNMTYGQVLDILGEPLEKVERKGSSIWSYQDSCPKSPEGQITGPPSQGFVFFVATDQHPISRRRLPQTTFFVKTVKEPDWSRVPKPEVKPAVPESKPAPVVEPPRILRPQQAIPPQAPPPVPVRPTHPFDTKSAETPATAPSRPFSSAYFLILGGAIIGLAMAIAFILRKVG